MLMYGLLGAITTSDASLDRLEHAGRRACEGGALEAHGRRPRPRGGGRRTTPGATSAPAGVSTNRPQPVVGRRHEADAEVERLRDPGGERRERLAGRERLRAHEVEADVAVAELEPRSRRRRAPSPCRARSTSRGGGPSRAARRSGRRARRAGCRGRARRAGRATRRRRRRCRSPSPRRAPTTSARPRTKRAPPTPPERTTIPAIAR